jgi:ribonuclease P/MRP protein subunit RPP40
LDKESYERAGLVGKPEDPKGKRGNRGFWSKSILKQRNRQLINAIVVEIDLRQASMVHGRKGFDRIQYAFKNAIAAPVTWLVSTPKLNDERKYMLDRP